MKKVVVVFDEPESINNTLARRVLKVKKEVSNVLNEA